MEFHTCYTAGGNKKINAVYIWGVRVGGQFYPYEIGKSPNLYSKVQLLIGQLRGGLKAVIPFGKNGKPGFAFRPAVVAPSQYTDALFMP